MVATNATPTALPYTGPAPPTPVRHAEEPRAVEPTAKSASNTQSDGPISMAPATVLYLLQNSAVHFKSVLELTSDVHAAGAVSGFSVNTIGGGVDTYG